MALTRDDIESELNSITNLSNKDAIRLSLSNYFEDLDEPVAMAIGINDNGARQESSHKKISDVISLMRQNGINAVSYFDREASKPDKFIVDDQGILFPFMSPKDSLKATIFVENLVLDNGFQLMGHANPLTSKSILYPASKGLNIVNEGDSTAKYIDLTTSHPDRREFDEIVARHGGDYRKFIAEMVDFAYNNADNIDTEKASAENIARGAPFIYRGGPLAGNPYAVTNVWNARKVAHASPAIAVALEFSGKGKVSSNEGGAQYEETTNGLLYGCVYEYESMGDRQLYYPNVGIETANNARTLKETKKIWDSWNGDIYETPAVSYHNPLKAIYLHVSKAEAKFSAKGDENCNDHKLFRIPTDVNGVPVDQNWRDFLRLHEPTDNYVVGYMAKRQALQKTQQTSNSRHAYRFELRNLEPKHYENFEDMSAEEFMGAFVLSGSLEKIDDKIYCSEQLFLGQAGIEKIPDLHNVVLLERFVGGDVKEVSATRLPENRGNVYLSKTTITDADKISVDRFCKILGYNKNEDGVYCAHSISVKDIKGYPQGLSQITMDSIHFPLTVNSIDDLPKNLHGIYGAHLTILDQSNIKDMSVAQFLSFLKGCNYVQNHHSENFCCSDLDLSNTNLSVLPDVFKNKVVEHIRFNKDVPITSLDDFPVTRDGMSGLNFDGDLKNETMESFLLKTKGQNWFDEYTERDKKDGHLIIKAEASKGKVFRFATSDFEPNSCVPMHIKSLPKDIDDVEFRCELAKEDIECIRANEQKKNEKLHIGNRATIDKFLDFSDFKAQQVMVEGLQNHLDLSPLEGRKELSMERVDAQSIEMPHYVQNLKLNKVSLSQPITWDTEVECLEIRDGFSFPPESTLKLQVSGTADIKFCSFPPGTTLDLSRAKSVNLEYVDLSKINVIMPKKADMVNIGSQVKFSENAKLDLSECKQGAFMEDLKAKELILPKKGQGSVFIPPCVKEIPTSYILSCDYVSIPQNVKIIDDYQTSDGEYLSLDTLSDKGVSSAQRKKLNKDRIHKQVSDLRRRLGIPPIKGTISRFSRLLIGRGRHRD